MLEQEEIDKLATMNDVNIDFSPPIWYPHAGATSGLTVAVGVERTDAIYPIRSALEPGLSVGQGADWLTANPTPDPFVAIESMISRSNPLDESMPGQINAEEAITLKQALYVTTLGGAEVLGVESDFGSISVGKHGGFIVLDQNFFDLDTTDIYGTKVERTVLGGKVVYEREHQGDVELDDLDTTAMGVNH